MAQFLKNILAPRLSPRVATQDAHGPFPGPGGMHRADANVAASHLILCVSRHQN